MLREQVEEGVHLRRKDENVNTTTLVDTSTSKYEQSNKHSYYYNNPYGNSLYQPANGTKNIFGYYNNLQQQNQQAQMGYNNRIKYYTSSNDSRYEAYQNNANKWPQNPSFSLKDLPPNFLSPYNHTKNDWNSLISRYFLNWVRKHPPNYHLSKKRFYPVFGKRSIEEHTHPEDKFFLSHHRSTRHDLYLQIEKFLDAKGKHGHHCVLRALCESGQRRNANEPDSFLKEILKAVFSLPTTHETPIHHKHRMYDEAHGHEGDCAEKFSFCQDSIWSDSFIF
ncbi:AAEL004030-PA [Aedes aegypti]|nr:AAEL004030-PA [Aedes aegypti]